MPPLLCAPTLQPAEVFPNESDITMISAERIARNYTGEVEFERLMAAAAAAQRSGCFTDAERLAEQALAADGGSLAAKFLLGIVSARNGNLARARGLLRQVVDAVPLMFEAVSSLSAICRDSAEFDEAITLARRAVQIRPKDPNALNNLGRCLLSARKLEEAGAAFSRAIALQPAFAAAHHNLGKARQFEGKDGEAAKCFAQAAKYSPTLENLLALGQILLILCDFAQAQACAERCVEGFPESPAAHLLLCGALIELKNYEAADLHLRRAIELDPDGAEALQLAARQRPLGYIDQANANLRRAIDRNPRQISAYDALMHNSRVTESDRDLVEGMQRLLEGDLSPTELGSIHFGLGKALEDLGEFEASMQHYDEANRIAREVKFGAVRFDRDEYAHRIDRVIDAYLDIAPCDTCSGSDLPVLIVGMMRSGTTLAEQILSSHAKVAAAGELLFWSLNFGRAGSEGLAVLGREYNDLLTQIDTRAGSGAARVTDKMPGNYMFAGFIQRALPNARLIHLRRSPIDTCLSIWTTPNHMPHEGGHDKGDIAFVYRQYLRLMEFWRSVLPSDRFLEIGYEALVADRESSTRKMVDFCGLEWDDACLRPEENRRAVTTPSAWQVRQPVYRTSVERWRKFAPWLGALDDLLELEGR